MADNSSGTNFFTPAYFNSSVKVALTNDDNKVVLGSFTGSVPSDSGVYAIGCTLFSETTGAQYQNTGTVASPVFTANTSLFSTKYGGKYSNAGGSATVAITVTGVATGDLVFAQIQSSANEVSIQKVTPTANTITILCSGDPGASVITYMVFRSI